jgi:hypothetical protein
VKSAIHVHGTLTRREEKALAVIAEVFEHFRRLCWPSPGQIEHLTVMERHARSRILYAMRSRPGRKPPSTMQLVAAAERRLRREQKP